MNFGFNNNTPSYKHSYWSNNAGASGPRFDFSSSFGVRNTQTHFNAPPVVQFSSQGVQVGRMVCGFKLPDTSCSNPPRTSDGRQVITICAGLRLECQFIPYKDGPPLNTVRHDISARLLKVGQAPNIGQISFANHERPEFMRMTKQPTREIHLAHPATADTQECINIGHKEQEAYFNTPMPFTLPEAEQALDWRNQELNSLIRLRDEVQAKVKENEEWVTGILQGKRGPRSKRFLRSLRGQNHNLWQTGQALEWRCQNATTRRDETAENLEKIKQDIEHKNEDYLNSIKSVGRGQFPRDHEIFNEERGRTEAAKHEERRFAALAKQEQDNYSSASAPATLDEARAAANTGLMHLENCVKEKNASEALCAVV
jgi:hypothetical protein